jgi:hypothetical protein
VLTNSVAEHDGLKKYGIMVSWDRGTRNSKRILVRKSL